ncbi:MAG: type II secretion system minor pseudopilin GspI [Mariprofundaceae bacterium]
MNSTCVASRGFTLLEVMVALAIAATALVVLLSRLGASADLQHDVFIHALSLETAVDVLNRERMYDTLVTSQMEGKDEAMGVELNWTIRPEETMDSSFLRYSVTVAVPSESPVDLFLYRAVPQP